MTFDEQQEWRYQEWCRQNQVDPEEAESAALFEEWFDNAIY